MAGAIQANSTASQTGHIIGRERSQLGSNEQIDLHAVTSEFTRVVAQCKELLPAAVIELGDCAERPGHWAKMDAKSANDSNGGLVSFSCEHYIFSDLRVPLWKHFKMFVCFLYINLNGVQQTKHSPGSSWLLAQSTFSLNRKWKSTCEMEGYYKVNHG